MSGAESWRDYLTQAGFFTGCLQAVEPCDERGPEPPGPGWVEQAWRWIELRLVRR